MRSFTLHAPEYSGSIQKAQSREVFRVLRNPEMPNARIHNPEFNHQIVRFDGEENLYLSARASVIALHPLPTQVIDGGELTLGEHVLVDGKEYVVTPRSLADPLLIPVQS